MPSKLSLHVQAHTSWTEFNGSIAPWIKVMDPPGGGNRWPGKTVVGRVYMPDNQSNAIIAQGAVGADEWFRFCLFAFTRAPYVTYWEAPNEPQPLDSLSFCRALSDFTGRLADLMHNAGLRVIGGCLSEGNPGGNDAERRQRMQAIAPGLARCDLWEQHCYFVPADYPHPEAGLTIWHAYRHLLNIDYAAQAGITLPPCYIGEAGIDLGIVGRPQQGWQALGLSHAQYMAQLAMFDDGIGPVTSAAIFTAGPVNPWHSFEVDQQLNALINAHIQEQNVIVPTRRISAGAGTSGLNLRILPLHERADFNANAMQANDLVFVLQDLFTTLNGSWDVGAQPAPYGIEQWARTDYLYPPNHPRYNPSGGGDHNSSVLCLDPLGNPYPDAGFVWTSNGAQHLQPPTNPDLIVTRTPEGSHGWANIPVFNNVQPGDQGWAVAKFGPADIVQGIGLPNNWHVSTFAVWRAMTWQQYTGGQPPPDPVDPDPVTTDLDRLVALAVPQMTGSRAPSTIANRASETLALLKASEATR